MKTETKYLFVRAAMMLLLCVLTAATAGAQTQYISEVMLIGKNNNTEANTLRDQYVAQGWTAIEKDLDDGCGSGTDYIYLLYKTRTTASPTTPSSQASISAMLLVMPPITSALVASTTRSCPTTATTSTCTAKAAKRPAGRLTRVSTAADASSRVLMQIQE